MHSLIKFDDNTLHTYILVLRSSKVNIVNLTVTNIYYFGVLEIIGGNILINTLSLQNCVVLYKNLISID